MLIQALYSQFTIDAGQISRTLSSTEKDFLLISSADIFLFVIILFGIVSLTLLAICLYIGSDHKNLP